MKEQGLVSTYTIAQYKLHKTACNDAKTTNVLKREFNQTEAKRFVVSDLTYVKVGHKWHYIYVLIDLFNRETIALLKTFNIGCSLSMKGCPYDNAVAEATYKVMKTEFINQMSFQSLHHL